MSKRIGIIIHSGATLFSNGITQNAWFIYECLTLSGYTCEFLCHESNPRVFDYKRVQLRSLSQDIPYHEYSAIIGVTKNLTRAQYIEFHRLRVPVIYFVCGNHFIVDIERFVYGHGHSILTREATADVIWIIPSFYYAADYLTALTGLPVFEIPHLWSPKLLEDRAQTLSRVGRDALFFKNRPYATFDMILMEPNISASKNVFTGLVVADWLFKRNFPIRRVYLANAPKHSFAIDFIANLTVPLHIQKGYKEMDELLLEINSTDSMPIFFCNQIYHELNYLYYECLNYGYPLVHNSKALDDYAYAYTDVDTGCEQVILAYREHTKRLPTYVERGKMYLERVNPYSSDMQSIWTSALNSLF